MFINSWLTFYPQIMRNFNRCFNLYLLFHLQASIQETVLLFLKTILQSLEARKERKQHTPVVGIQIRHHGKEPLLFWCNHVAESLFLWLFCILFFLIWFATSRNVFLTAVFLFFCYEGWASVRYPHVYRTI